MRSTLMRSAEVVGDKLSVRATLENQAIAARKGPRCPLHDTRRPLFKLEVVLSHQVLFYGLSFRSTQSPAVYNYLGDISCVEGIVSTLTEKSSVAPPAYRLQPTWI